MSEMKVALKGLTCANCAGKIEDTLSKLSETQEVSINLLRQEMTVKLAPNASAEKMQETVERVVHKFEPEVEVAFLQGQKAEHHHAHHEHCGCGCEEDDDDDDCCACGCGCGHHHEHGHHHADEVFTSWGVETPNKYDKEELSEILRKLSETDDYGNILRAKGMLPCTDGKWMFFDLVPEEYEIREGKPDFTGRICVIGAELKEAALKELFNV